MLIICVVKWILCFKVGIIAKNVIIFWVLLKFLGHSYKSLIRRLAVSVSVCVIYIWHNVCTAPRRRLDRKIWCHWPTVLCVKWTRGTGRVPQTHLSPDLHSLTCMYLWSVGPTSLNFIMHLGTFGKMFAVFKQKEFVYRSKRIIFHGLKMLDKLTVQLYLALQSIQYLFIFLGLMIKQSKSS